MVTTTKKKGMRSSDPLFLCPAFIHPSNQIVLNINFSSRTTSLDVQRTIEAAVEKRTKNIFGPPVGRKLIAFVDDMNMPRVDNYGTQQPIALLKLLVECGGMYDRGHDLNWKLFKDICKCFEMEIFIDLHAQSPKLPFFPHFAVPSGVIQSHFIN